MPGKAAKVRLSERQLGILTEFSKSRSLPQFVSQRAMIICLAFEGHWNEEIASVVGLERHQVGLWRRRWADAWEGLCLLECSEPLRLREAIRECLTDAPRAGCRGKISAVQIAQILAVACETPELSQRPITHWTAKELRDEVLKRGIVSSISVSQIGRYLRQAVLQPHRQKMWINTTETDPVVFQQEVELVCHTYLAAMECFTQDGTRTVCCDEMTGLQALERPAPDQAMQPGQVQRREFEYIRHGTTTLIGNWDVVAGTMFAETIGPTRTETDFVTHVATMVATDPDVPWRIVLDRLNVHWSASLVLWVAAILGIKDDLGVKGQSGVLKNQASRRAFLSDSSHRIRFVFLPKHSSWLNQIEVIFGIVMRKVMRRGDFTSVDDLEDKLRQFLKYFNETMARPFDWTYTGKPISRSPMAPFCPPHRRSRRLSNVELAQLTI
jgi:transposase